MIKKIILSAIVLGIHLVTAQVNWINKNMFEQKNFIENKGQWDDLTIPTLI